MKTCQIVSAKFRFLLWLSVWLLFGVSACASVTPSVPTPMIPWSAPTITPRPTPTPCPQVATVPQISWLENCPEYDAQGNVTGAQYRNKAATRIASFNTTDPFHQHQVTWHWEQMTAQEKDWALRWLFDPRQMRYINFENRERWFSETLAKWIPRLTDFTLPADATVAAHWPSDAPPMSQYALYEALSRIKTIALIPARRTCNYGYSHLGLIEFGGETILFTAAGWQKVSVESREIFATVWTIKEAMVIYYPQTQNWVNACPNERDHLKNENYSTIWLIQAITVLARATPQDRWYWNETALAQQWRALKTQTFPACATPLLLVTPVPEPCLPPP